MSIIGLFAILGFLSPVVALVVVWLSQTFLQLVLLPVIMVGQNVLGRKSELQAEEAYATTMKTYADIEAMMKHFNEVDEKIYAARATDQSADRLDPRYRPGDGEERGKGFTTRKVTPAHLLGSQ